MSVTMHGPAFDESGELVQREVPEADVHAFQNVGYSLGGLPPKAIPEAKPEVKEEKPKKGK